MDLSLVNVKINTNQEYCSVKFANITSILLICGLFICELFTGFINKACLLNSKCCLQNS